MINMSGWPTTSLDIIHEVSLDPRNVRLENVTSEVEADIISDLIENEDLLSLVEGICTVGYLTHETPIAVAQEGKGGEYTVLEGNRRVAALKIIQNGVLAQGQRTRVENLTRSLPNRNQLTKAEFKIAPTRDDADQLIAAIHTSNLRRPWTPQRQAAFFAAQLHDGRTLSELLERYPTADVKGFVLYARLRDRIAAAKVSDREVRDVLEKMAWKRGYSTLTRIFESEAFQTLWEPSLTAKGQLRTRLRSKQVDAVSEVILAGLNSGDLNTRTINRVGSSRFRQLTREMREAAGEAPIASEDPADSRGAGQPTGRARASERGTQQSPKAQDGTPGGSAAGTASGEAQDQRVTKSSTPGVAPKRPRRPSYLPVENLNIGAKHPSGIRRIYEELTVLNVRRMPNLGHAALRMVLERNIKAYAERIGEDISKSTGQGKKYVQLDNCLQWLDSYWTTQGPKSLLQPVRALRGNRLVTYTASVGALNATNHNHNFVIDHDDIWSLWDAIEAILIELAKI